jgi:O-antigen ligase
MSPQIHTFLFGYHPHSFAQTYRGGGWRPVVLTSHGLELSLFMSIATLAAAGIARRNLQILRVPGKYAAVFLAVVVIFCKSTAATLYMIVLLPLIAFARPLVKVSVAAAILTIVMIYPTLRIFDVFPTTALTNAAVLVSDDRAQSLEYRFRNEDLLMERIRQRPIAGWGGYSRSSTYAAYSKKLLTVPDGYWLVRMASGGVLGILPVFAVFSMPVFLALARVRKIRSARNRSWFATLALMIAVIALDVLPNAEINSLTFFLPGALLGAMRNLNPRRAQVRRLPDRNTRRREKTELL